MKKKNWKIIEFDYKLIISIIAGLLCFLGIILSFWLDLSVKIEIIWSLIFPFLVTSAWGMKYGIISMTLGLGGFFPFLMNTKDIWMNLIAYTLLIVMCIIQGYGAEKRQQGKKSIFYNALFLQLVYSVIYIFIFITIYLFMYRASSAVDSSTVLLMALRNIINYIIIIAICDTLFLSPMVRRIFLLPSSEAAKKNVRIILFVGLIALISSIIIMCASSMLTENKPAFYWLIYRKEKAVLVMVMSTIMGFFVGGVMAGYFEGWMKASMKQAESDKSFRMAELEIMKLNAELEQRVNERTAELQIAVSELETFAFTVSHDLKSPLRAINAYSRIMLEDYHNQMEGEIRDISENIKRISKDMITLINKLLQYSITVRLEIKWEIIDLGKMISMIFKELASAIPERNIKLIIEKALPQIKADKVLLKQVIYNVISNAIKFTRIRSVAIIKVGFTVINDEIIFYVNDNGIGFDTESSGKLFSIFQRLHPLEEYDGTGIGLATVKKIIHRHGGRTWIEGKPDLGATVYFTLPVNIE